MAANLPESFQLIFQNSPLAVAVVLGTQDGTLDQGLLLYANPALLGIMRTWRPDEFDIVGILRELSTNETGETLFPLPANADENNTILTYVDFPDQSRHWYEVRVQPTEILGERGHFYWLHDVTTTKEKELEALQHARNADAAAEAKSNFLATMSHEIRTPLQTIFGMLELLTEENPTNTQSEMIGAAKNSANGLLGILDDILDLAKVEAGKMELDNFETPLRTLIYGIIEALEVKRRENNLYIKAEIDEDVPFVVHTDAKRMRQILLNLIGNGLKFTESGGLIIHISTKVKHIEVPENYAGLRFEIVDTGIGMTPEVYANLFKPFTQADNTTTRRFGGTGLGLSIAKRLVELMGGKIGVRSKLHKGTTFWFEFAAEIAPTPREIKLPDLTGLTVLSIEDHPRGAQEIQNSLQSMGAIVTSANTLAQGLDLATKRPFDVAVVDHGMPDGWGADILKELNILRPFMGLILYTVHDDYHIQQICKFLGAKHLAKPASRLGLGEAVRGGSKQIHRFAKDGPRKLLICEDNATVRDIFNRQLHILGVEADFANDGQEAWDILQEKRHGIVITDLHMPRMDGYGLARVVRAREKEENAVHMPVIAMTADVQLVHEQSYLAHGFDECLLKPVSLGQIKQLLIRWGLLEENRQVAVEYTKTVGNMPASAEPVPPLPTPTSSIVLPNKPIIDEHMAVQQFGAFDDDAKMMIGMFIKMSEPQLAQIQSAYDKKDWSQIKNIAHSLKGAARSACCMQLGDVAETLQLDGSSGFVSLENLAKLVPAFDAVKTEYARITA